MKVDAKQLLAEVERLKPWHHEVELAPGIGTMGLLGDSDKNRDFWQHYSPEAQMRRLFDDLFEDGQLGGRSFLDCACNSGAHTIAAARAGAGRCFAFDARELWVEQGRFLARHFDLPNVTIEQMKLEELPALALQPFDVTLFSGIFYHLPDPVAGLKIAADLTRDILILNTSVLPRRGSSLTLNFESATEVLSGVDRLAWLPSGPDVLRSILAWCGFKHSRIDMYRTPGKPKGRKRIQIVAAWDRSSLTHYDARRPDALAHDTAGLPRRIWRRFFD